MSQVSVREFSYNPSAMFARVERGESLEVTRHGKVIAVLVPGSGALGKYADLVSKGVIKLAPKTTSDLGSFTRFEPPPGADPLQALREMREEEGER
jgi:antitoxin (DNA-binding transcriptional repressor) of toxin-antitoxin stability system